MAKRRWILFFVFGIVAQGSLYAADEKKYEPLATLNVGAGLGSQKIKIEQGPYKHSASGRMQRAHMEASFRILESATKITPGMTFSRTQVDIDEAPFIDLEGLEFLLGVRIGYMVHSQVDVHVGYNRVVAGAYESGPLSFRTSPDTHHGFNHRHNMQVSGDELLLGVRFHIDNRFVIFTSLVVEEKLINPRLAIDGADQNLFKAARWQAVSPMAGLTFEFDAFRE